MFLWSEYLPDVRSLRVYCRDSAGKLSVTIAGHKIVAQLNESEESRKTALQIPLDYHVEKIMIGELSVVDGFQSITVRLPSPVDPDWLNSIACSISEDWSLIHKHCLICRNCEKNLDDLVDIKTLTPCLLPSATWGFEDMRVCEECGPLVAGSCQKSVSKKTKKNSNFFVTDTKIFLPSSGLETSASCPHCDAQFFEDVLPGELRALDNPDEKEYMKLKKMRLGGPLFSTYTVTSEFFTKLVNIGDLKIVLKLVDSEKKLFLNFLTGLRDLIVVCEGMYFWGARVIFNSNSLVRKPEQYKEVIVGDKRVWDTIVSELEKFALPQTLCLSKQWRISLVRLTPVLVEL